MAVRMPFSGRVSKTSSQLRGERATYDEENNNGDGFLQPPRSMSLDTRPEGRFACPFFKANCRGTQTNDICARNTWPNISRLKEHLYRRHSQQKLSCSRCFTSFDQDRELEAHLRAERPCKLSDARDRPAQTISPAQMHRLRRRKGLYGESEETKWYEIWDILFPDREQPASPCVESREALWGWDLHTMDGLQEFMKEHITKNVADSLGRQSLLRRDTTEDDENIRKAICGGVVAAFQQYKGQFDDDEPTPPAPWLREPQHPRFPAAPNDGCESPRLPPTTRSRPCRSGRSRSLSGARRCSTSGSRAAAAAAAGQDVPVASPVAYDPSLTSSSRSTAFSDCPTELSAGGGGGGERPVSRLTGLRLTAEPPDMATTSPPREQAVGPAMWGDTTTPTGLQPFVLGTTEATTAAVGPGGQVPEKAAASSDQLDLSLESLPLETGLDDFELPFGGFCYPASEDGGGLCYPASEDGWLMSWNES